MRTWIVPVLALVALILFLVVKLVQHMPPAACRDEVRYMELTVGYDNSAHCDHPKHTLTSLPQPRFGFLFSCTCSR